MAANFEYYRIFYYVARYKSFTKAATFLMSSQPAISRCMKILEHELGCMLFIRTKKGVSLTPEGEALYNHVSLACEEIFAGEAILKNTSGLQGGVVRIGTSETALQVFLLERLEHFHSLYPDIKLRISNSIPPESNNDLKNGSIDFAVVSTPTGASKPLAETELCQLQDILIAGNQFKELQGRTWHLEELKKYPLICLGKGTKSYSFFERLYSSYHRALTPDIEAASTDLILPMVKHNFGIGFLPESSAAPAIQAGEVFQIDLADQIPLRSICLVEDPKHTLNLAARRLREMLF